MPAVEQQQAAEQPVEEETVPTAMEDYLFDLRGYLIVREALSPAELADMNRTIDAHADMGPDEWRGWVHNRSNAGSDASGHTYLHNLFECGPRWEQLIDHPRWIKHMHRYCGGPPGGTPGQGLYLDENFVIVTHPPEGERRGGATMLHSGAHKRRVRTQFRYHDGEFRCGMLSLIVALTPIGEGDGATIVRPFAPCLVLALHRSMRGLT